MIIVSQGPSVVGTGGIIDLGGTSDLVGARGNVASHRTRQGRLPPFRLQSTSELLSETETLVSPSLQTMVGKGKEDQNLFLSYAPLRRRWYVDPLFPDFSVPPVLVVSENGSSSPRGRDVGSPFARSGPRGHSVNLLTLLRRVFCDCKEF